MSALEKRCSGMLLALVAALVLTQLAVSGCASGDVAAYEEAPAAVRDYDALLGELHTLAAASPHVRIETIGIVSYDEVDLAVVAARFAMPDAVGTGNQRSILVTGGVHGNEPAGAAWAVELIRELATAPGQSADVRIDVIPIVNPWGWIHDVRYNRDGRDINRDFASFETQEARIIRDFLSGQRYSLVIDHHEDPDAAGVYLYQYGKRDETVARAVIDRLRGDDYPIEQDVKMVILKTDDGLIDAPMWGLRYMRLTGQLSITNYIRLSGDREVFTVETPVVLPMDRRVAAHGRAFTMLSEAILGAEE